MVSTVWRGTLTVGLLSLGVSLYSARERHGPTMHQFVRGTDHRVRYRKVDEETGKDVGSRDIVKGARVDSDEYVILEPDDLAGLTPGKSKTMEITGFVPADSVEPVWYSNAYFLSPQDQSAAKPYRLLCAVLERTGRVALATMVMRDREHLVLVGPQQGVLTANTLFWPDEIRAPSDVMPPVAEADISERDLGLAEQLVEAMAEDWDPDQHEDVYQKRLQELIEAKSAGRKVRYSEERPAQEGTVVELTDALRKTLKDRKGGRAARAPEPRRSEESAKRAPAGRTPAKGSRRSRKKEPPESDLGGMTKKELLRRARELDVPGRSKMSREDLESAVRERISA